MNNWKTKIWEYRIDGVTEYWTFHGQRFDTLAEAEDARGRYEMAEQDHFDNVRKGEE